jgi:hypothetical protein
MGGKEQGSLRMRKATVPGHVSCLASSERNELNAGIVREYGTERVGMLPEVEGEFNIHGQFQVNVGSSTVDSPSQGQS